MSFYLGMLAYYGVIVCASVVSSGCRHMFHLVRAHYVHSEEVLEYMQRIQNPPSAHGTVRSEDLVVEGRMPSDQYSGSQYDNHNPTCDAPVEYKHTCSATEMTQFARDNPLCSICMDAHPMNACTRTVCGHIFGQTCFRKWTAIATTAIATTATTTSHYVRCPNCTQDVTSITTYHSQ